MLMKSKETDIVSNVFRNMFTVQILTMLTGIAGSVVDGMVTGKFLGEEAMAAFGFTTAVTLLVAIAGGILSTGTSVICGKSLGEGELSKTRRDFSVCFSTALTVSVVLAILIIVLAVPTARVTGAQGEIIGFAADYIRGYGLACPAIIFVAFLMPIMQMDGELKRLMAAVFIMTGGDIAADLLNVLVFHGGMFGMALATAISYYLALLCLLPHFFKKDAIFNWPSIAFEGKTIRSMIKSGSPTAITQLGRLMITFMLNHYLMMLGGSLAVAAHTVIMSVGNLCLVPGTALGSAVQVITGVLYGAEDHTGIKRLLRTAVRYNVIVSGGCMLFFILFAKPAVSMFYKGESSGMDMAVTGFRYFALCMIFYGMNLIFRSYCQSSRQTNKAYTITICDCFIGPLAMALLIGTLFGIPAMWLCFVIGEGLTTVIMLALFQRKNKDTKGIAAFIPLPQGFGQGIEASFEHGITENDLAEAVRTSQSVKTFCKDNGADERTSFLTALSVEEVVGNIMEYGFDDGKPHRIELRLLKKSKDWILCVRDDCRLFDPKQYLDQFSDDDPSKNIGLKLLRAIASDITYLNALSLNNLTVKLKPGIRGNKKGS